MDFSPTIMNMSPGYFHRKIEKKMEPKKIPSVNYIPHLFVVFTQQLEILVTSLGLSSVMLQFQGSHSLEKSLNCK